MIKAIVVALLIIPLISCVNPGINITVDESANRTNYILKDITTEVEDYYTGSAGSVSFSIIKSEDNSTHTSKYRLIVTIILSNECEISPGPSLQADFETRVSTLIYEQMLPNSEHFFIESKPPSQVSNTKYPSAQIYYKTSAEYYLHKDFLERLSKSKVVPFAIQTSGKVIRGNIILAKNPSFMRYYNKYIKLNNLDYK